MTAPRHKFPALAARILTGALLLIITVWACLSVYFSNLPATIRPAAAFLCVTAAVGVLIKIKPWRKAVAVFFVGFIILLGWWLAILPTHHRNWRPDVAVLPFVDIGPDKVTIHHIRRCAYQTENDYTVSHYDKNIHIADLKSVDLFLIYNGALYMAYAMISFGFTPSDYVCFSIEPRRQKGQAYDVLKGFFKQYELIYVVADERDAVRLRTIHQNEEVYLYRLNIDMEKAKTMFLAYSQRVNQLKERAEWFNPWTHKYHAFIDIPYDGINALDRRLFFTRYFDEFAYEKGLLEQALPFSRLKARSYITAKARTLTDSPDFSRQIRKGLPGFP